ncbi:2-deoxyglucose-6-phosphatase [Sarracenia purpurea var. burkii]
MASGVCTNFPNPSTIPVYALCGAEFETRLPEFLFRIGNLGELSTKQLKLVNDLLSRLIRVEEKLTSGRLIFIPWKNKRASRVNL